MLPDKRIEEYYMQQTRQETSPKIRLKEEGSSQAESI